MLRSREVSALDPTGALELLAKDGLRALPPARLPELAEVLWAEGERSGDARAFVLSRVARTLDAWWDECDEEAGQGLPSPLVDELDEVLANRIPAVLSAEASQGLTLASALREEIGSVLQRWHNWQRWYPDGPPAVAS
jgi:hypothetical protein